MPELPEVETFKRYFARHALGQRIARVDVRDERILTLRKETFVRKLKGREFTSVRRHGKHLFADAGATWLHLHFGMTGDLAYYRDAAKEPRFAKIVFELDGGAYLAFEDMRLFGLAELVDSPDAYIEEQGLGPDPLDPKFTFVRFAALLEKRRGAVKSLLMSQEILAGLGNLYADEILYQTSIHPRRPIDRLKKEEERAIFTTMRRILRDVITRHGNDAALPARYLYHHREEGEKCPKCGGAIKRTVVFGRTTYFCGKHQK
ncbi:MAG TPA: DNA-formamidopyrimidine glycosylase family protein [Thermoanaerobaculia bacterium]|nr:DNA-formamidopyrimidine glycosylase family protein [Thermoanaerobaculia bacterium]